MNRIYLTYAQMAKIFREVESSSNKQTHIDGYIVFSQESFEQPYDEQARTYVVSSNNKAYQPNMGGYSIYGGSLDHSDPCVRLERYMAAEKGGNDGWKIECCYICTDEYSDEVMEIVGRIINKGGKKMKIELFGVMVDAKEVTWFELDKINLYDHHGCLHYAGNHLCENYRDIYALFMSQDEAQKYCVKLPIEEV